MKIDFHVHAFPDALAQRAITSLTETVEDYKGLARIAPITDGTAAQTRKRLEEFGVDAGVLMPIATRVGHQKHVNDWAAGENHGRIIAFGSVHPLDPEAPAELDRILRLGLKGVKLHPDYQGFFVDDPTVFPIYEKMEDLGLPVLFHAGQDPYSPNLVHGRPKAIAKVAREFPRLTIIAAHLGGVGMYEESMEYIYTQDIPNLFVDTSMAYAYAVQSEIRHAIRMIGADKVLFASDMPWSSGKKAIEHLEQMGFKDEELERIFYKNALRLLRVPIERIGGDE